MAKRRSDVRSCGGESASPTTAGTSLVSSANAAIASGDRWARHRELVAKLGWNEGTLQWKREYGFLPQKVAEKGNSERRSDDAKDAGSE